MTVTVWLHVVGALEQGLRNSRGTKPGGGKGLGFSVTRASLNKLSVAVTVTVWR
jgi:hypothetical protein